MATYPTQTTEGGFTLIELMVSIAIVIMVMGIVLFKYNTFNDVILLKSQAYEIALDVRTAQESGVSVETNTTGFSDETYGIHFATGTSTYSLYSYPTGNPSSITTLARYTIDPRFQIAGICSGTAVTNCPNTSLDVTFTRPDFTANMVESNDGSVTIASVVISAKHSSTTPRIIQITQAGQVSVQ